LTPTLSPFTFCGSDLLEVEGRLALSDPKTVGEYLDQAITEPRLRRNTHHYISDMLDHYGTEVVFEGLYGMEEQIENIVMFFHAHNTSLERRLLLFVGPQGAGKSSLVDKIKKFLDHYSHTEEGALYGVQGDPFHAHPFDLVPHIERPALKKSQEFRWYPEAIASPVVERMICQRDGAWREIPIERIYISTTLKVGLAKHTPTDLRREDITNFIGNINFSKLTKIGSTYDPDSFDFEGKIIWANRGILDWTEIFKSRRQLLGLLLELIQSKRIDMANFPTVHVDEMVIGHTNFPEYNVFVNEDIMEPLRGRIFKIEFPYNLEIANEGEIYRSFLQRTNNLKGGAISIADDTLRFVATYAVATRVESKGLRGLSPRFFQDVLSRAYTSATEGSIDLALVIDSIQSMFAHKSFKDLSIEKAKEQLEKTKESFLADTIQDFVQTVVPEQFQDYGQNLYLNFLTAIASKVEGEKLTDSELKLVDEVENLLVAREKISPKGKPSFENVLVERKGELLDMDYKENEQLGEVINELVFDSVKNFLRLSSKAEDLDDRSQQVREILLTYLQDKRGYSKHCAESLFGILGEHI
jgi:serine protein kinase